MNFFKNIWKKKIKRGMYFGSSIYELEQFRCGLGEAVIEENKIIFKNYPFEPSSIYPNKPVPFLAIDECHLENYPSTIKIQNELIFISKGLAAQLKTHIDNNILVNNKRSSNWSFITAPFLDTDFDEEAKQQTMNVLKSNGISPIELEALRKEIEEQMYKYNFDTMLWEWGILGLHDVLLAMRPKYNKAKFEKFYWKAMEVEQKTISA